MRSGLLSVTVASDEARIGRHLGVSFQRTLRIPYDGGEYPLPPGLGRFPVFRVADYAERVPESWRERGGVFIPMYQREALWLSFQQPWWRPVALKIGVGKVNAVSGKRWTDKLRAKRQDYVVCPDQPWLDGINAGNGFIRQFVAMPLGMGYTVEGQLTGEEGFGGIQLLALEPKPGLFPEREPKRDLRRRAFDGDELVTYCVDSSMGLGAGGRMRQEIYPDEHGIDTWDPDRSGRVYVHIVNSMDFREITGLEPPPTPISARMYTDHGLPWFDLYREGAGDLDPADEFAGVRSVKEIDAEKGFGSQQDDESVEVSDAQVVELGGRPVKDGDW